ncbi:MAG TPA: hypothetical protein VNV36_06065 [Pseudomonas sp.]|uniref:hypothetical protein n=1 Tax=Pseudomonas sp. TaxID=306 RepID=UPI002B5C1545|nr:hypothetical protein [Pseudomonas sp.]HWH86323.1 hypothetical protein [Pseudomonas sp.]
MHTQTALLHQPNRFAIAYEREGHQFRVLTPELAEDLANFNWVGRELTRLGVPILISSFSERCIELSPTEAKRLYAERLDISTWAFQPTAGGCRVRVCCRGIYLHWFESITTRPIYEVLR